ncbi:tRNA (guanosine(37)-N1)-methyltransferase TrmD [Gammaproteobacteria bacterium]|nr:tRNA (guanosine(37)-N1)-methyltransferase TrmD [Gammaproteobacteria bacterium]
MRIDVLTLFPPMFSAVEQHGIPSRAIGSGALQLACHDPRKFAGNRYGSIDDRPFGGGPGMVMQAEPLAQSLDDCRAAGNAGPVCYLSPQGRRLDQRWLEELSALPQLVLVAGRYEGVDERFIERHVDFELSVGDYVLSGGELAAMTLIDGISRLLPGVLGCSASSEQDSFSQNLLDCPHYTRPESWQGLDVPPVLKSGDHQRIARWRREQSLERTWRRRPDLIENENLDAADRDFIDSLGRKT